jgi:hypothetical protein
MESLFLMITSEMTTSVSVPSPTHRRNITPVMSLPDLDLVLFRRFETAKVRAKWRALRIAWPKRA